MSKETDLATDQKIETHKEECTKNFVAWPIFIWVMGFILAVFGWFFYSQAALATKVSAYQDTNTSMREDIATIKEAVTWLKNNNK